MICKSSKITGRIPDLPVFLLSSKQGVATTCSHLASLTPSSKSRFFAYALESGLLYATPLCKEMFSEAVEAMLGAFWTSMNS